MSSEHPPRDEASADLLSPVEAIRTGPRRGAVRDGVALCLSGGGYRAMLFHAGALWRLNEARWLPKLDRISSVSGGSITAALLGLAWSRLDFDQSGRATRLEELVVTPLMRLASMTIDVPAVVRGILTPGSISHRVERSYRKHLFGSATLQDLPDRPRIVINATNMQSGALWRFMKPYMRDYRVGQVIRPKVSLALAVAASAAFPPFLGPVRLRIDPKDLAPGDGFEDLRREPFTSEVVLCDGGVYDNLGLETAWKRYRTILVSDAGGRMRPDPDPHNEWAGQSHRVLDLIDNQVRCLRKRQVVSSLRRGKRKGAYWGIRSDITHFRLTDSLECPCEATMKLADTETRLAAMPELLQERLINWGYAVCDAAMRKHADRKLVVPEGFPYPAAGVGD
ncbi:MAG: patatin-like phospholipase family protein [Thermoanaerobaculia bacterium]|nr:patatin-like phospholipase family protein [Thermoanaerobaculia bacterium]